MRRVSYPFILTTMTRGASTGAASRGSRPARSTGPSQGYVSTTARQTPSCGTVNRVEHGPVQHKSSRGGRVNYASIATQSNTTGRAHSQNATNRRIPGQARAPLASIHNRTPPPSTDPVDCEDETPQGCTTYIGKRKRTYEKISSALGATKRQRINNEILEPYYQLGRWTQRGIDLDPDVHHIIKVGIALSEDFLSMDGADSFAASDEMLEDYTEQEQQSILALFNEMISYESDLEPLLAEMINQEDIETFNNLLDEITPKVHQARTSDLNRLKTLTSTFIAPNPHVKALDPPLTVSISKSDRGINHPVIAALFCPREHVFRMLEELNNEDSLFVHGDMESDTYDIFENEDDSEDDESDEENEGDRVIIPDDTTVIDYIQQGGVELTADGMDAFLYDLRKVKAGKKVSLKLKGFLCGYILPRAYRAVFLGPNAIFEYSKQKSRPSVAVLHHMVKVTPKTIAYAIVLARFSMSNVESWSLENGSYNLRDLYDLIVRLLSNPHSLFAKQTLQWWNDQVFGGKRSNVKRIAPENVVPSTSAFNELFAADAARSLRRVEKSEDCRQREEAERRKAESTARKKVLEDMRADRRGGRSRAGRWFRYG
ncbi:hypothetical protein K435DRAFT_256718 [Dendrothele bispora CBS 962.96]|uniref:Uncharacterized protein n=1 Tax=Dendrothele bispora (strain CBS 962.96) TaxID=1314807 RepID=A0A4S8LMI6_DENBC|nr:hypothetical protein K435DRAFT_256718 [Dendrothele bispora CBS 962.96]